MKLPLWEILSSEAMKSNRSAQVMLTNWEEIKGANVVSELTRLLSITGNPLVTESPVKKTRISKWLGRDLRLCDLRLKGIKGIPYDNTYGISTSSKADAPVSVILMGHNGSGKSTVYAALELLFRGESAAERKHQVSGEDRMSYYHHFGQATPLTIIVRTAENLQLMYEARNCDQISNHFDASPFFCSESDIALLECSGMKMEEYLDEIIGFSELIEAGRVIDSSKSSVQEEYDRRMPEIDGDIPEMTRYEEIIGHLTELEEECQRKLDSLRQDSLPRIQKIMKALTEDYLEDDIELGYEGTVNDPLFNGCLKRKDVDEHINPRHFFNNFRMRLYILCLRIAVAFHAMKSTGVSFPLIFDDIFDSSDFGHRLDSKEFFEKVIRVYGELKINSRPLQIIFFTQDDVIGKSVYDGCRTTGNNVSARLVRLFRPEECDGKDSVHYRRKKKPAVAPKSAASYALLRQPEKEYDYLNLYDLIEEEWKNV